MGYITLIEQSPIFFYFIVFTFGLMIGSFLNVVIYRLPKMMEEEWRHECSLLLEIEPPEDDKHNFNLLVPRSSCPNCGHKITAIENIPVISYIALGGKCSDCGNGISARYPVIEITSALLALTVAMYFGPGIKTILALVLTWSLLVLSVIDYDHKLLPDSITLPILWLGIIANMFGIFTDIYSSLFGAILGYLILWFVYIIFKLVTGKEGMGHGDFKLLAMLGAWLGWQSLPLIIILSSLVGSVIGIGLMVFKSYGRSQSIPFGPYLAMAGWIALLFGVQLVNLYLNWIIN